MPEENMAEETTFVRTKNNKHHFLFRCDGCRCLGSLEIPIETRRFNCPEECGASYVLWNDPLRNSPAIMCVVCPVFVEETDEDEEEASENEDKIVDDDDGEDSDDVIEEKDEFVKGFDLGRNKVQ